MTKTKEVDIVKLHDEHEAEIVIVKHRGKFLWHFLHDDYPEPVGPYATRKLAIAAAEEYCGNTGIS